MRRRCSCKQRAKTHRQSCAQNKPVCTAIVVSMLFAVVAANSMRASTYLLLEASETLHGASLLRRAALMATGDEWRAGARHGSAPESR